MGWCMMLLVSPCLANRVPKPQPTPPSKTPKKILQAYISGENSEHNHNQNELIEIYTITYQGDSCMKGIWEVLDEGVGGSLPTHLQELLPSCKGEQSLTFKETRPRRQYCCPDHKGHGSIASHRWQYQHLLTRSVSEMNREIWTWNTQDRLYHLTIFTSKELWSWNTKTLRLSQFYTKKL